MASVQTSTYDGRYLKLTVVEESYSIEKNTSTIRWTLESIGGSTTNYTIYNWGVWIDGREIYPKTTTYYSSKTFPASKGSQTGTFEIEHRQDGKYQEVSFTLNGCVYYSRDNSYTGTISLTDIPRKATISSAPDFNDEENPVLYYSNPAGNSVTSLKACISLTGSTDDISYRDISKTDGSYTFNLTTSERNILRNAISSGYKRTVRFFIQTVIGGITYLDSTGEKTFELVNYTPVANGTYSDTNTSVQALTNGKIILGMSNIAWTNTSTARKNATISNTNRTASCGTKSSQGASGTFTSVDGNSILFSATDSRGNYGETRKYFDVFTYTNLTCDATASINTSGVVNLVVSGNYTTTFPATSNTLSLSFRYKRESGDYTDWKTISNPTISSNKYNVTVNEDLQDSTAYTKTYTFQVKAVDKLLEVYSADIKVKGVPVFDWSESDFNFNVPVSFSGKSLIDLIYPVGSIYMSVNNVSPQTFMGGTWEQLKDRFLIGAGGSYNAGSTSGSTTHTHSYSHTHGVPSTSHSHGLGSGYAQINHHDGSFWFTEKSASYTVTGKATASGANASTSQSEGIALGGSTDSATIDAVTTNSQSTSDTGSSSNMPPYLAVYMWKRTR